MIIDATDLIAALREKLFFWSVIQRSVLSRNTLSKNTLEVSRRDIEVKSGLVNMTPIIPVQAFMMKCYWVAWASWVFMHPHAHVVLIQGNIPCERYFIRKQIPCDNPLFSKFQCANSMLWKQFATHKICTLLGVPKRGRGVVCPPAVHAWFWNNIQPKPKTR